MIFISKYITPKGYSGITLFPFIFLKKKELLNNKVLINHEKIHLRQQIELLVLPFYTFYILEFLLKLIYFRNRKKAYRNISFEKEAYAKEADLGYLKNRIFWSFINYF